MLNVNGRLSKALHLLVAIVLVGAIIYSNYLLISSWFVGEFNQNMASIEIAYIQMAKFWVEGGGSWNPLWYLGYPWHVFYTPLLPALAVLTHQLFGYSFAHAYRVVTGVGYILVPASVFLFVWQIAKSKTGALVAALFYSFAPSLIAFIFQEVAADSLSGLIEPRRYTIMVRWGEGPHILALVFLPLFGFFASRFLEGRRFLDLVASSLFLGLVALTNAVALWAAALMIAAFCLAALVRQTTDFIETVKKFFFCTVLAFGLIAFWYNLPFIGTFFAEGGGALANWQSLFPWGLAILLGVIYGLVVGVKKTIGRFAGLAFTLFWFLALFAIVYIYYASGGTGEERLEFAPQALRLNTEVDLAVSVLLGTVVSNVFLFLASRQDKLKYPAKFMAVVLFICAIIPLLWWGKRLIWVLPKFTKPLADAPIADIKNTNEFKAASELKRLTRGTKERVLAPGNYGFWLNYFVDVPQLRGALFQSSTHFWPDHIYYQLANGADADISLAWLKIANIGKLVYTTIGSGETYKDFRVPQTKFDQILTKIIENRGDIYYQVPLKNDSLAKVVDVKTIRSIKKPFNAIDEGPIFAYAQALEQKDKRLAFSRVSPSRMQIAGSLDNGEGILVQETYDSGWSVKAGSGDGGWRIKKDSFDFMVLVPKKAGEFQIELIYRKPLTVWLGYLVTLGTIGFIARRFYLGFKAKSKAGI